MYTKIIVATILFASQIVYGNYLMACATPGLFLSTDQQYCFGYVPVSREWNYHVVICDGYATRLVNIDSADKQAQVEAFLSAKSLSSSTNIYIGLTNIIGDSSNWLWFGGNITSYTNWATGEPASGNKYNCAYISVNDYKWYAQGCLNGRFAVCEREATAADVAAAAESG